MGEFMTQKYYSQLTTYGQGLINQHSLNGEPFIMSDWYIAAGTGNLIPSVDTSELVNKIFDKNSADYPGITVGTDETYGRYAQIVLPSSLEGNIITELGLFDSNNQLVISAKCYEDMSEGISSGLIQTKTERISLAVFPDNVDILYINEHNYTTLEDLSTFVKQDGSRPFLNEQIGVNATNLEGLTTLSQVKTLIEDKNIFSKFSINNGNKTNNVSDVLYIQGSGTVTEIVGLPTFATQAELVAGIDGIKQLSGDANGTYKIYGQAYQNNANYGSIGANGSIVDIIDLGVPRVLKSFDYWGYVQTGTMSVRLRTVEVSTDKAAWVPIHSGDVINISKEISDTTAYRYLRITFKNISTASSARFSAFNIFYERTVSVSSATTAYAKVGGNYSPLTATTASGKTSEFSVITGVNCSTLANGTYNICLNPATNRLVTVGVIYKQPTRPTMVSGDLWLDTSQEKEIAYYYNGTSDVIVEYIPVGTATVAGGVIIAVTTNNFNSKKVTVPNHTRPASLVEAYNSSTTGYIKFSNGLVMQWFQISATTTFTNFTLPVQMADTNYLHSCTPINASTTSVYYNANATSVTQVGVRASAATSMKVLVIGMGA